MKLRKMFICLFSLTFANTLFGQDTIQIQTENSSIDLADDSFEASGGITLTYGDMKLRSDRIKKLEGRNIVVAYGNVVFQQGTTIMEAPEMIVDLDTEKARIIDAKSYSDGIYFGGEEGRSEYPERVTVKDSWFTTSPFDNPVYKLKAKKLVIEPDEKIEAHGVTLEAGDKDIINIPYYVSSLRAADERGTLFPYVGKDSDRGLFGIMGFQYNEGPLAKGFVDLEISEKKKVAVKFGNTYVLGPDHSGNILFNRYVLPFGQNEDEWDVNWRHRFINRETVPREDRKFYQLGNGIWELDYDNITTNLMYTIDGDELDEEYPDYVAEHNNIGTYDFNVKQEIGKDSELELQYYWTDNESALRDLVEINDAIADEDDIDPRKTDVDLSRRIGFKKDNREYTIRLNNEKLEDINPGYIGDSYSYRDLENYELDLKVPKVKLSYLKKDEDKYEYMEDFYQYDEGTSLEEYIDRTLQTTAYDYERNVGLELGNYYPFLQNDYFGYDRKSFGDKSLENSYFGFGVNDVHIKKKTYDYDFTTDNDNYRDFFYNTATNDLDRIYKIYENEDEIRETDDIIDESYMSYKARLGNDKIPLNVLGDTYVDFNYEFEQRDYDKVAVPEFDEDRDKIEDLNSDTGYKIKTNASGDNLYQSPEFSIHNLNANLTSTLYDNTKLLDNEYDIKIVNKTPFYYRNVSGADAMYDTYDIVEYPTNMVGFGNDLKINVGNVGFNYRFDHKREDHWKNDWKVSNSWDHYFKTDINNSRYLEFYFGDYDHYDYIDFKDYENKNYGLAYGYKTDDNTDVVFKYKNIEEKEYSNDTVNFWDKNKYKEKIKTDVFSIDYGAWGFEYRNIKDTLRDIYQNNEMDLKLRTNKHRVGFTYDSKKDNGYEGNADHYLRLGYEFGKDKHRDYKGTYTDFNDDSYARSYDNSQLTFVYRYDQNSVVRSNFNSDSVDSRFYEYDNVNRDITKNKLFNDTNNDEKDKLFSGNRDEFDLFLTEDEQTKYDNLVEEERDKQNRFNIETLNTILPKFRTDKKYFELGLLLETDNDNLRENGDFFESLTEAQIRTKLGLEDKFQFSYNLYMERPNVADRDRTTDFSFRQHELGVRYMFSQDPDYQWWLGYEIEYTQDGALASDGEEFESSSNAESLNKVTRQMITLAHRFETVEWEIGIGKEWENPDDRDPGMYDVVSLRLGLSPFRDKNLQYKYTGEGHEFGIGL